MKKRGGYGGLLAWACFVGLMAIVGSPSIRDATAQSPVTIKVYDPTGAIEVTQLFAARLADLHGKTICEVSGGMWEDQRTFSLIGQILQRQFPTAKIVPYTEFPVGTAQIMDNDKMGDLAKAKGCQAVIVGNAG
jgi:hypothetical protein